MTDDQHDSHPTDKPLSPALNHACAPSPQVDALDCFTISKPKGTLVAGLTGDYLFFCLSLSFLSLHGTFDVYSGAADVVAVSDMAQLL